MRCMPAGRRDTVEVVVYRNGVNASVGWENACACVCV